MSKRSETFTYSCDAMLDAAKSGKLPIFVSEAFGAAEGQWDILVQDAVARHQAGKLDLIAAFSGASEDRLPYGCQQFLEEVLPKLEFTQNEVLSLVTGLAERSRGHGLPYFLSDWFQGWCETKSTRPWALVRKIKSGGAPDFLRHSVYYSGLRVDRRRFLSLLIQLLSEGSTAERATAANLLGRFDGYNPEELDRAIAALRTAIRCETGEGVTTPLRSLLYVASSVAGKEHEGVAALADRATTNDKHVRSAVASEMMFQLSKTTDTLANAAFATLMKIGPGEDDTIDAIDQILSKTLVGPLAQAALALLDHLLVSRAARMTSLDSTAIAILNGDPTMRLTLVGSWLRSPSFRHFDAILDICRGIGENTPKFDIDMSGWSHDEALRSINRASAILLAFPATLASILVSALRTAPTGVRPHAENLLFDPLLLTFWTVPRTHLESVGKRGPRHAREAIARVLAAHDDYKGAIGAADEITELRPSEHHRILVDQKHREESRSISRDAMKKSIFGEIFPTSMMLYGDAAIYDVFLSGEESTRQETELVGSGFSSEVARYDMVEPFWARYRRDILLRGEIDE